nr:PREDICTED: protein amalgam-like isoform X1 [Bemisia tabaci]
MKCFTTITLGLLCVLLFIESGLCRPENRDLEEEQNDEEGEGGEGGEEPNDQGAPDSRRPPIIKTQPMTITVEKGQTAILPCEFQDLGNTQTMWLMNSQQLFIGAYKFDQSNTRFNLTSKLEETGIYNLKITNVTSADAGIWTCKLLLTQTHQPHISHKLEVKLPAAIQKIEPSGVHKVQKGSPLHLKCEVTGSPIPEVKWIHKHRRDSRPVEHRGDELTIAKVDRTDSGFYECTADNGLNGTDRPSATVEVIVLFAPEIAAKKDIINTAENTDAELICTVHGHPTPKVTWFKEMNGKVTEVIDDGSRYKLSNSGNQHILTVDINDSSDFGNYSCVATNEYGETQRKIEVFGTPLAPVIQQVTNSTKNPWSNFKWKIVSSSPILEYELKYWKSTNPEKFHTVRLPVQNAVSGNIYELEHAIADVENTKYEVVLRAMNTYGWSKFSEKHYFAGVQSDSASPDVLENIKSKDGTGAGVRSTISALVLLVTVVASLCC